MKTLSELFDEFYIGIGEKRDWGDNVFDVLSNVESRETLATIKNNPVGSIVATFRCERKHFHRDLVTDPVIKFKSNATGNVFTFSPKHLRFRPNVFDTAWTASMVFNLSDLYDLIGFYKSELARGMVEKGELSHAHNIHANKIEIEL